MKKAVYAGSFDPPTKGHFSMIKTAAALFDEVYVCVANNPAKRPFLSKSERVAMLREELASQKGISVVSWDGLTIDFARSIKASFLVRGIRNEQDARYELKLAKNNESLAPRLTTVFIPAKNNQRSISSSLVRLALQARAGFSNLTTARIANRLQKKEQPDSMHRRWHELGGTLGANPQKWQDLFTYLARQYNKAPHGRRAYHNLSHIEFGLHLLEACDLPAKLRMETSLAFWFHDVIYVPWRKDNERRSANTAQKRLFCAGIKAEQARRTAQLVEMTASHRAPATDLAGQLLNDLDLAIFAASPQKYRAYEAAIRREFNWVPGPVFRKNRAAVLKGFLERAHIFATPWFGHKEQRARTNLKAALIQLETRCGNQKGVL